MSLNFFNRCLELAKEAAQTNEVPIGAVIIKDSKVIAEAHNQTEKDLNFIAHAETLCIQRASQVLKTKHLNGCELYVTVEPCRMCLAAASLSRIDKIYYLIPSLLFGEGGKGYKDVEILHSQDKNLTRQAKSLLQEFFQDQRSAR